MNNYKVGDIIRTHVTGITKYGIFVSIDPWYNGLIHISEVSEDFVKDIHDYVKIGETIYCQILDIDEESQKMKLSIKNINYKELSGSSVEETRKGFLPLKENLDKWIDEKLKEYK